MKRWIIAAIIGGCIGLGDPVCGQTGGLGASDAGNQNTLVQPAKKSELKPPKPGSSPGVAPAKPPAPKAPQPATPAIEDLLPAAPVTPTAPGTSATPPAPAPAPKPAAMPAPTVTPGDDAKPAIVGPRPQQIVKPATTSSPPAVTPVPQTIVKPAAPPPAVAAPSIPVPAVASPAPAVGVAPAFVARGNSVEERAVDILLQAALGPSAEMRSNALEAMQVMPDRALPMSQRAMSDPNPAVRFAAVVSAGMLKFRTLGPAIKPLLQDPNDSVRAAAVYALWTLGEPIDLTPLADMLRGPDPRLRGNVAMLLGLLGDKSAVPLLKSTVRVPMPRASANDDAVARIQVSEAIGKLGDDSALDALRAGMYSQFDEVRVLSITALGAIGDRRMELAVERFIYEPPVELQLAAAASLARLGNFKGLPVVVQNSAHADPVVRAQAAWTLGWFSDEQASGVLQYLMKDAHRRVQVAAAGSILRRAGRGIGHQPIDLQALPILSMPRPARPGPGGVPAARLPGGVVDDNP
jgi:HEAT repeat protein